MTLGFLSLLTLSVAGGCSDDFTSGEVVCHKGDTRECLGPGACQGAQECTATGSGFQPCQCGDAANQGGGGQGSDPGNTTSGANNGGTVSTTTGGMGGSQDSSPGGEATVVGGGGSAAGAGGSGDPHYECDPISNVGCSAAQNCSLETGEPKCVKAGTKVQLAGCTATSDCAPGLFCHQSGNCLKPCTEAADCTTAGASLRCDFLKDYQIAGLKLVGGCLKQCDALTQNCPAGQACSLGACFTPTVAGSQGDHCDRTTQCAKGFDCLVNLDGNAGAECSAYCSTTAQNPCGQGLVCFPLHEELPTIPTTWGICMNEP